MTGPITYDPRAAKARERAVWRQYRGAAVAVPEPHAWRFYAAMTAALAASAIVGYLVASVI